jgi:hypothetical protein
MLLNTEDTSQIVEYISLTNDLIDKQAAEIGALKLQAVGGVQPVLPEEKIAATVSGLIEAGLAKEGERQDLIERFKAPEMVLQAVEKIAALHVKTAGNALRMGKVAARETKLSGRESDQMFERRFGH